MKFSIDQSTLSSKLATVNRLVPTRPSHPVLANILINASEEDQTVELTGFDLSTGIKINFDATVDVAGIITIPSKIFSEIISKLPEGILNISIDDQDENLVKVVSLSGHYDVRGMASGEYPDLPQIEGEAIELPTKELAKGIKSVLFCASADETKQVLTGVHIKLGKVLEFAATDGHRLARTQIETDLEIAENSMTIPAKALKEVERLLSASSTTESVSVKMDDSMIEFSVGNQLLICRKLEGQFPIYNQLIPNKHTNKITVDRRAFLLGVERIGVLADQRNNIIKCSLSDKNQNIALSVDAKEVGNGEEVMPAQLDSDEPKEIAFNVNYLTEGLKGLDSQEVQLQLNSATSPVVIQPLSGDKTLYLIMPVQLRN